MARPPAPIDEKRNPRQEGRASCKFTRLKVVRNDAGEQVVLTRNGEILILDPKGRELEKYEVPAGAILMVEENSGGQDRRRCSASGIRTAFRFWPKSAARSATKT